MAIALATTTIAVLRKPADANRDPYDAQPAAAVVVAGVRAHISSGAGNETVRGGSQSEITDRLGCDPVELLHTDQVRDETTLEVYDVVWARRRLGNGLDHTDAGLRQVRGLVNAP